MSPRAQTMSKNKALEALTEARGDLLKAQKRLDEANQEANAAAQAKNEAQDRVDTAQGHLNRAIEKEVA
jgi:exonuclease VII small subunit